MKKLTLILTTIAFSIATAHSQTQNTSNDIGKLKLVAQLNIRPGNVTVSKYGRIFSTIHPLGGNSLQLVEITGTKSFVPFPNNSYQKFGKPASNEKLDSPLGLVFDSHDHLWAIDMGLELGQTRLWCFDIHNKKVIKKITLPENIAPKGSFIQDLVVDDQNGWAYLADINNPGIIAVNLKTKEARRFSNHPSLQAENIDMIIDGKTAYFNGKPLRVGIDPITLSADNQTLYYGAMSGNTWYEVPTRPFREGLNDSLISSMIKVNGKKPLCDGATTATSGNHYFTDLQGHAISKLSSDGTLSTLIQDENKLLWPDGIHFGPNQWLYISTNQLNTTPAFTGQKDEGHPPYYILKVFTGENGVSGR